MSSTANHTARGLARSLLGAGRPPLFARTPYTLRVFSSSSVVAPDFDSWLQESATKSSVREYLGVSPALDAASLSLHSRREIVTSADFISKVSAVSQWAFGTHAAAAAANDPARLERVLTVVEELSPWGNMAKGDVWQHFYIRRFFLSRAPLDTFLACYEIHCRALEAASERALSLPAALLLREFVWRGRFDEALAAYSTLTLDDHERRSFSALLHEYEQYATLRKLYHVQDTKDRERDRDTPLLDPLYILQALRELGRRDEMVERFEMLPHEDQGRADIQKLLSDDK